MALAPDIIELMAAIASGKGRFGAPILVGGRIPGGGEPLALGRLTIFEHRMENSVQERSPVRMRRDGLDHLTLQLVLSGSIGVGAGGRQGRVRPGEILLLDMTQPLRVEAEDARVVTFVMARDFVELVAPAAAERHGAILCDQRAGLLADMMMSLARRAVSMTSEEIAGATQAFGEVLALALSAGPMVRDKDVAEGGLDRSCRLIEVHLASKALTPDFIAAEAGLSRSRLYELFKPLGGVSRFIQHRRAARLAALLSRDYETRSIAELAYSVGFSTESHASRMFRDIFGVPPGQFRREAGALRRNARTPSSFTPAWSTPAASYVGSSANALG